MIAAMRQGLLNWDHGIPKLDYDQDSLLGLHWLFPPMTMSDSLHLVYKDPRSNRRTGDRSELITGILNKEA